MDQFSCLPREIIISICELLPHKELYLLRLVSPLLKDLSHYLLEHRHNQFIEKALRSSVRWSNLDLEKIEEDSNSKRTYPNDALVGNFMNIVGMIRETVVPELPLPTGLWSSGIHKLSDHPPRALIFGGEGRGFQYYNNVYILDIFERQCWPVATKNTPPAPRGFPSFHIIRDYRAKGDRYAIVFGGQSRDNFINWQFYSDTYLLNLKTWEWEQVEATGDVPSPRVGHRSCIIGKNMWVFGGTRVDRVGAYSYFNDLYKLDLETKEWELVNKSEDDGKKAIFPAPRHSHCIVPLCDESFLVYGGNYDATREAGFNLSDVYVFNTVHRTWSRLEITPEDDHPLPGMWCHQMLLLDHNKLLVLPGLGAHHSLLDYHIINLEKRTSRLCTMTTDKIPVWRMFYCALKIFDRVYMIGGELKTGMVTDHYRLYALEHT